MRASPGRTFRAAFYPPPEVKALNAIRKNKNGDVPLGLSATVPILAARSLIRGPNKRGGYIVDETALEDLAAAKLIWLPNVVVDGADEEVPPLELIRQTRSLDALRLFIELYGFQFLPLYNGIPRTLLRDDFEREKIGERGPFVIWGFRKTNRTASAELAQPFLSGQIIENKAGAKQDSGWQLFWKALDVLVQLGLLDVIGLILEGDDDDAEAIHPYGYEGGEAVERELATAAFEAGCSLLTEGQVRWAAQNRYYRVIPIMRHIQQVAMQDIFRLKYRPHTSATAAWFGSLRSKSDEYLPRYRAIADSSNGQQSSTRKDILQHQ